MNDQEITPILYGPRSSKSLLRDYPELADEPALKGMDKDDLYFAWLIGIEGSPVDQNMAEQFRYNSAASKAYPLNKSRREQFSKRELISEDVKMAIKVFEKFRPDARLMAKKMIATIFNNYKKLVDVDPEKDFVINREITSGKGDNKVVEHITEVDWTGRKQYIDSSAKIAEVMPSILKQLEEGFGISDKKTDITGKRPIDLYIQSKGETKAA